MKIDLTGRSALVTGQHAWHRPRDRGHARGCGARVAVVGRDKATADAVAAETPDARGFACDVTRPADVLALVEDVEKEFGALDILVNNAGITKDNLMLRIKDEDWDAVLDANLRSAFLAIRAASRGMMKRRWGRIVNISSVVGLMGNKGQTQLRREQGRADRPDQVGGQGTGLAQHPLQRDRARVHRDRHDRAR